MRRVTGIGGIFMKARNPEALQNWYRDHLGIDVQSWGGTSFKWDDPNGVTVWSIFPSTTEYFNPSSAPFMVNYRVENLTALLEVLRQEGCAVDEKTDSSEYGKFGWVTDPEGNRVELWEPPAGAVKD